MVVRCGGLERSLYQAERKGKTVLGVDPHPVPIRDEIIREW